MKRKLLQCPYCPCRFASAKDYAYHQQAHIMYPERFANMNRERQQAQGYQGKPGITGGSLDTFSDEEKFEEEDGEEW
ncbi:hypothetical protein ES703_100732 [subsurface metagenome]